MLDTVRRDVDLEWIALAFHLLKARWATPFVWAGRPPFQLDLDVGNVQLIHLGPHRPAPSLDTGVLPVTHHDGRAWGLWFHAARPVATDRLLPLLAWCAGVALPVALRKPFGRTPNVEAVRLAEEYLEQGLQTPDGIRLYFAERLQPTEPELARAMRDPAHLPSAILRMGDRLTTDGDHSGARAVYGLSYSAAVRLGDQLGACQAAQRLGRALRFQGQWADSEHWYSSGRDLADDIERLDLAAIATDGLGNVSLMRGRFSEARRRFTAALGLAQASGERLPLARAHHSLMIVANHMRRWADAMTHGHRAIQLHDSHEVWWTLHGLAEALFRTSNLDLAEQALALVVPRAQDAGRRAVARADLARVSAFRGDLSTYRRLMAGIRSPEGDHDTAAELESIRAESLSALGLWSEAAAAASAAVAHAEASGAARYAAEARRVLDIATGMIAPTLSEAPPPRGLELTLATTPP